MYRLLNTTRRISAFSWSNLRFGLENFTLLIKGFKNDTPDAATQILDLDEEYNHDVPLEYDLLVTGNYGRPGQNAIH